MVVPSLIAILAPIATGLIFGVPGVLGLLIGGLSSGFVLAIFMANAGGARIMQRNMWKKVTLAVRVAKYIKLLW